MRQREALQLARTDLVELNYTRRDCKAQKRCNVPWARMPPLTQLGIQSGALLEQYVTGIASEAVDTPSVIDGYSSLTWAL